MCSRGAWVDGRGELGVRLAGLAWPDGMGLNGMEFNGILILVQWSCRACLFLGTGIDSGCAYFLCSVVDDDVVRFLVIFPYSYSYSYF